MNHITQVMLLKTLDGLEARSVATAENIANASTPGYRPLRVSFEDALKAAAAQGESAVQAVEIKAQPALAGSPDSENRVDLELARASSTAQRYDALIEILGREMALQSMGAQGMS
jgi:flagellar basal-body rod protein FlgB